MIENVRKCNENKCKCNENKMKIGGVATSFFRELRWRDDPETLIRRHDPAANGKSPMSDDEIAAALGGRQPSQP